jgi:hypothetical protein
MANLFIDLDLGGAASSVSALGKTKTFNATGSFSGALIVEANCGGEWRQVLTFNAPGNKTLDAAFQELRLDTSGVVGSVSVVSVSADDTGAKFVELPVNGAAVDVSALGTYNTVVIGGDPLNGLLKILVSDDGADFTDWKAYQSATVDSDEVVTQFMKAEYDGTGTPEVCIGAINETDSNATPVSNYVYRPGATDEWAAGENVYTDWNALFAALQSTKYQGTRTLEFDGRFSGEVGFQNGHICRIPEGTWEMEGVDWTTVNRETWQSPNFLDAETIVVWADNAFTPRVSRMVGNYLHDGEVHSPLSSAPVIGDTKWVTRLINTNVNALPMIRIPDNTGFIIIILDGACQAVTDFSDTAMPAPIMDFGNTFTVVGCRSADIRDNFFAGTGFAGLLQWPGLNGSHSWDFPFLTGFFTQTILHGGKFMNSDIAVDVGDFTARGNQHRRIDSNDIAGAPDAAFTTAAGETTLTDSTANFNPSLVGRTVTIAGATTPANNGTWPIIAVTPTTVVYANAAGVAEAQGAATYVIGGPIVATLPSIWGVVGEVITLTDVGGAAGLNPISVVSPSWSVDKPYLTRPFQSKTWRSQPGGTWLLVADSYEDFVTVPDIVADQTAINNATNVVDTTAMVISLTLPLAATAEKGAIIRVANIGATGNATTILLSGGDTIVGGAASVPASDNAAYQSDGGTRWIKIS